MSLAMCFLQFLQGQLLNIFIFNSLFETIYVIATIWSISEKFAIKEERFSDPKYADFFKGKESFVLDCWNIISLFENLRSDGEVKNYLISVVNICPILS